MEITLTKNLINLIEAIYAEYGRGAAAMYLHKNGFKEISPGISTILSLVDAVYAGSYWMDGERGHVVV